jgi:prepilin-type processing-associated H-X9-DG protein
MDYEGYDDILQLDQSRHSGGSNYAFVDGSARHLKFGKTLSYMINGWNDYVKIHNSTNFASYYTKGNNTILVPESAALTPTDTISFGEKDNKSGHFYMDYEGYDDILQLDQSRHSGGSNYAFVDGSARHLKFGKTLSPLNLWALSEEYRNMVVPTGP